MVPSSPVIVSGAPGSPYTRKMLGVLRYRRIPYSFVHLSAAQSRGLPQPKVSLLPTFYLPGPTGKLEPVTDSSPIIRRLEREYSGRSVIPPDPVAAFIDFLLEDYGDEWLTKAMFHYRWAYPADIKQAAEILPHWRGISRSDAEVAQLSRAFAERQIGRLHVVGSNETTAPVIEASYHRLLELLNAHLREFPFLMGARPGASDFAIFGQLTQLAQFDPTPMQVTLRIAPRVYAWVSLMEDLSGMEPAALDWLDAASLPATLRDLLNEVGRGYVPVMLANARAIQHGAAQVETVVDGKVWVQPPFAYQAKCLKWIRDAYRDLGEAERRSVDAILAPTGCMALFAA
ncbi:MAG: glutathione S-transferase family protein [Pseudomonadota bacterium]